VRNLNGPFPRWAASDKLKKFINARLDSPADHSYSVTFIKQVKAYYFFSSITKEEEGSIGYDGDGITRSTHYKKLF